VVGCVVTGGIINGAGVVKPAQSQDLSWDVLIAADHAGIALKSILKDELIQLNYHPIDLGTHTPDSVDYPDFAKVLAEQVLEKRASGILICGSGIGMSIAANRYPGIRAALCHDGLSARLAREHNDGNVLVLGERLIGVDVAKECVRVFFSTPFSGGRHQRRVEKMG